MTRHLAAFAAVLIALAACSGCRAMPDPAQRFAEAERLRVRQQKAASEGAIAAYQQAQTSWQRQRNMRDAARAAQGAGATQWQLGSVRESLEAYRAALSFARESPDRLLESEIRSDVGVAQAFAADNAAALDEAGQHCQSALAMARTTGIERLQAKALDCLGEVAYFRQDLDEAIELFRHSRELWERAQDQRGQAQTLLHEGYVYSDLSRFDQAAACFDRARSLWIALGDKREQAITMVADARLRQRRGENQEALNGFLRALSLLEPIGDIVWEASSLTGVATVYLQMADSSRALKYWERAYNLFETAGLKSASVDILISLGTAYLTSGDDVKALSRFERALAVAEELESQRWESYALRFIGVVYLHRRLPERARQYLERGLHVQQSLGDLRLEAQTRGDLGDAHVLQGDHTRAREYYESALRLSRAAGDRLEEVRVLFGLGRASLGLADVDAARHYIERSLQLGESIRTDVQSQELRTSYLASIHPYYELHVEALMRLHAVRPRAGMAAAAFEAAERARARSLLESLTQAGVDLRKGVDPDLLARESAARRALDGWAERQGRLGELARDGDAVEEYRELEDRYNQIQAEIRSRSPRYAALTQPQPLSLAAIQQQVLDGETLLLAYALGEKRSFLWSVSRTAHVSYELPPRAEIESAAQRVYQRLTARLSVTGNPRERRRQIAQADDEYWIDAQRLSEMLLGPVAASMSGKRILVVADGALQYLPFAALPIPGSGDARIPIVVEHEIVSLPSASVLAVLRSETRNRMSSPGTVAVLADPVFEADDPRLRTAAGSRAIARVAGRAQDVSAPPRSALPWRSGLLRDATLSVPRLAATRQEADAIIAAAPQGTTFKAIDFDASRATALGAKLAKYRILHFATHGVFNDEQPGLAGLVLSMFDATGKPQDGLLRLHDIYGLNLPAELVVLSACNTALGKPVRGEGLVGMVRGFMYAGAKRVIASHWKVDDEATGELMGRLYAEMLKQNRSPAAALRAAQLAIRQQERWQSPFYWAAFVLQGEWN